jgi:FtsZ-interacting cell division protein YlmF
VSTFTRGGTQPELARRVVGFCSGLVDAVGGHLHVIGENVVLLAPDDVELPEAESDSLRERRFFNQM